MWNDVPVYESVLEPCLLRDAKLKLSVLLQIMEARDIPYSICEDCNCKLKDFATFRKVCLTNDEIFRKLFPMVFEDGAEPDHQDGSFTQPGRYELDEKQQEISDHSGYVASYESPSLESFVQKIEYLENDDDLSDCTGGEHSSKLEGELEIDEKLEDGNRRLSACVKDDSDQENEQQLPSKYEVHPQDALPYSIQRANHDNTPNSAQHDGNIQSGNKASRKRLCPICGKLVYDISDHKLSHTNEKKYACPHCSMAYSRKAYLKIHIQSVHQKKVVKTCDICNQDFAYKTGYDAHMRARHNIGKWYECKPCNMKFRHPGGLRNHNNRKHNEGSNCECPVCGLKFLDK
ncbi:zinc finger and SCAN domain-containing protein 12-like [Anopheles stephensi]|uniref:zinc finger and SCAN domain-containing protein 12-like n=1 Tax=Anopheles stephensi TaxID=30069 RepID=UPI001658B409|nr:zinc finger and SCAN domain-containing protein 12-like [Anopheles stephensi]